MKAKDDAERAMLGVLPDDPEVGTVGIGVGEAGPKRPEPLTGWVEPDERWLREPPPLRQWLTKTEDGLGFLPRGEVGILAAPGSSGKTWMLVALALALATGTPWVGMPTSGRTRRVVLLLAEDTADEVRRRIQAQAAIMELNPTDLVGKLRIMARDGVPGPIADDNAPNSLSAFGQRLLADMEAWGEAVGGIDLVILDPLSNFGSPDCETDNHAATTTMRAIERFTALPGSPAVLVAHHTRKQNATERRKGDTLDLDDIRGASGLVNRARWAAILSSVASPWEGVRVSRMEVVKANYCPPLPPVLLCHPHGRSGAARACFPDEIRQISIDTVKPALSSSKKDGRSI